MPIQYAEIFINVKEETYYNYFKTLIGVEKGGFSNDDTIILSFNNGEFACDTREAKDMKLVTGPSANYTIFPNYFCLENNPFYITMPTIDYGLLTINFSSIFANNPKYVKKDAGGSIYNVKYQTIEGVDVFSIVKMKSPSKNPRFIMAYDDEWFNRENLMVLVNLLLKNV